MKKNMKDIVYNGKTKNFSTNKTYNNFLCKIKKEFKINNEFELYANVKNLNKIIKIEKENDFINILNNTNFENFIVKDSNNKNIIENQK